MFNKILIANRGEIACRIIQTAHRMGIRCVAVYSEADANARHVAMADEAFYIGPAPSSESYLRADKIIEIAKESGAQAIHPGYGFLSENTDFAEACEANDIVFIGPPSSAIAAMGSKSAAKAIMEDAGVPLVPGYHGKDQSPDLLRAEAEKCGFPLLLKAVAGGGGKGMRVVENMAEFDDALAAAQREAKNAFGNPDMLIERYLTQPRHVEIQVFCDQSGNGIYLAERDCSVQRRHQKVLEEAPAPGLSEDTRKAMGEAAVRAAQAINYVGAGTVEFLYDVDGSFFFMEMNTRLQVEHPVTEMVTGQDLVEWQLKVAWGEPLPLTQDQVKTRGHAIEARIYAEDPDQDFLPATGTLRYLSTPDESAHVRVDTGVTEGDEISIHYDPMIAKLIVWDETREQAVNRMVQALEHYRIAGLKTNIRFLHAAVDAQPFREAELTTNFIATHNDLLFPKSRLDLDKALVLAAGFILEQRKSAEPVTGDPWSPFGRKNSWRMNSEYAQPLTLQVGDDKHELKILERDDRYQVFVGGSVYHLNAKLNDDYLQAVINGHRLSVHGNLHNEELVLFYEGDTFKCTVYRETYGFEEMASEGSLAAPMNGSVVAIQAQVGDKVTAGQTLVIMEAMKMEHAIKAPADGVVSEIFYAEGDQVAEGAELIAIDTGEAE
ncbi:MULTISPECIES: acetyl/propionyl/methylcrotonyl-CoA carboxylase subunit alpha [Marinobacter]|jgi:3-methylcrotonyl-CoA carboxylase alpha subunit|uniref:acetyl/propionyl/methylcrotonyl-CoA carboxylase subunit alpha n=1 Tax=Marinobacter TaxID=2742 RepID=UPI000256E545|nr:MULTISPECIES: acetyl/propionyl/methylcrotonyl-CoA carboxylase subunit alpha [Marinobacter]MCG8523478.1 acetyl/propionyl/methylcrotonyl-CoA carboxylase subunit alpha [Pseudomonadales bacterium]MEC9038325.1 acetyl/propionyl/methylcrotonyl-CoA carboxylase subunit alpha [Pseudomonadota bacterium]MEC9388011.1 acetyl/propionyl/methylcrotonyl-CoA carboxylase subunit alpha [Pseudomonadota bacterium]CCG94643.1 3-methylcrotonyl-CoA carboxylase biotin-containig subunit [Marinobacter nauticus ATCC 49840|tara:strand:+ start:835 stop:2823 length:1989 start_codon:yes stop_codon:yes gene_type:complete